MEIFIFVLILLIGLIIFLLMSLKGKSTKRKFMITGTVLMASSPFIAIGIGISYGIWIGDRFASFIMIYIFPALFITGLFVVLMGITDKKTNDKTYKSSK